MIKKFVILLLSVFLSVTVYAQEIGVDCLILEDENSIICKYTHLRVDHDKNVTFNWIDPDGELSRTRTMSIPAYHGSIYDFRYIKGRASGEWKFEVVDGEKKYTTNFIIE